ncbi:MAG TPA: DUF4422 domain-containing protein [Sunxiuqinia sp.]|nr:DUF4422 domain-containing protein [Sunxiuqinia sp.]
MDDYRIYIAFHREGKLLAKDDIYTPLHVGWKNSMLDLNMQNDATGNNISASNEIYSELTGWYWIWQNRNHDYIGTGHYRRYFTAQQPSYIHKYSKLLLYLIGLKKKRHGMFYVKDDLRWQEKILSRKEIQSFMHDYDAILPEKKQFKYSVYEQYKRRHKESDLLLTRKIIEEKYPSYLTAFDEVIKSQQMYSFNMFIMPWHLFDEYMSWLFDVLFELEERSDIDRDDKYQKRVCAFMAERLQTVWFQKKQLKVKELPILYFKKLKTEHF